MKLWISHTTTYTYDAPVIYGLQRVRLTPSNDRHQSVLTWTLAIEGAQIEGAYSDQFQNHTSLIQADIGATKVVLTVSGDIETHTSDGISGMTNDTVPMWLYMQPTPRTTAGPNIQALSKRIAGSAGNLDELHALSAAILHNAPYQTAMTTVTTTAEEALTLRRGVCQDHAQIFIAAVRHTGLPARYISGYLLMDDTIDQDASHAWAEVYVEHLGWVGFDVSNGISPDERYVRLATGRDSKDAAPISGLRLGASVEAMNVSLQIQQQ